MIVAASVVSELLSAAHPSAVQKVLTGPHVSGQPGTSPSDIGAGTLSLRGLRRARCTMRVFPRDDKTFLAAASAIVSSASDISVRTPSA